MQRGLSQAVPDFWHKLCGHSQYHAFPSGLQSFVVAVPICFSILYAILQHTADQQLWSNRRIPADYPLHRYCCIRKKRKKTHFLIEYINNWIYKSIHLNVKLHTHICVFPSDVIILSYSLSSLCIAFPQFEFYGLNTRYLLWNCQWQRQENVSGLQQEEFLIFFVLTEKVKYFCNFLAKNYYYYCRTGTMHTL